MRDKENSMKQNYSIPKATIQRYPIYLKALRRLQKEQVSKIMSSELSEIFGIAPTTIRRDFSLIGSLGKQGYGYDVERLISIFSDELGVNYNEKIILIGCGNLGHALLNYNKWNNVVGEIVCAFDINPSAIHNVAIPVYGMDQLKSKMPQGCRIAILCITQNIQRTVDELIDNGIRGIVNFTQEHFSTPNNVSVKNVDVVSSIQEIVLSVNSLK